MYRYIVLSDKEINKIRVFLSRKGVQTAYSLKKGYVMFEGDDVCSELIAKYSGLSVYKLEPVAAGNDTDTKRRTVPPQYAGAKTEKSGRRTAGSRTEDAED
ncbi:MAG: hypothetical protein LRY51_16290 [Geovibrio sp.]|nr:hypothetical protein [Geovibrio sp.]